MISTIRTPIPGAGFTGGCWPTPKQTLLLRAAILDAPGAMEAWTEWQHAVDLDKIDAGSFRLLGLLYRNLVRLEAPASAPLLPRLKGIYRYFWTRNQLVLKRKSVLLLALAERGIPCMLLKGAALTLTVYRDYGVRPMDDFDLMVPPGRVAEAMELLERHGWVSEFLTPRELPQSLHACHFRDADDFQIDLHWQLCHVPASDDFDRELWAHAIPVTLQDASAKAPCHTDQFINTCEHGPRYNTVAPLRWLADAAHILRATGGQLDWRRVAAASTMLGTVLPTRQTLAFLRQQLATPVPEEAFRALAAARVTWQERYEAHFLSRPTPTLWHKLPLDFSHHLRAARRAPWYRRWRGFPDYFRHANNLTPGQFTGHYRAQVARWFRVWLPWHLRHLRRMVRRPEPGSIGTLPADTFHDFHEAEPLQHRLLRWSMPRASLHLIFPEGARLRIELDLGGQRDWATDLSRHLQFELNGRPVPREDVEPKEGTLRIAVPDFEESSDPDARQVLAWTCEPLAAAGDPRALGLPILAVRVISISK